MDTPAANDGKLALFRNPNFTRYLAARIIATLGVQMQSVAIGWQVYQVTGELFDLGLIGLAQFAPFVVLVLPAGEIADRYDRKRIITVCLVLQLVCSVFLLGFTFSTLSAVWPIFAVLTLFGAARAFMMPASQAILINIVPPEAFGRAVALNSSMFHMAVIVGPVLGGFLYLGGPRLVYGVVAVLLIVSIVLMLLIKSINAPAREKAKASLARVLEGLRFVWSRPIVLGAISLDLFAVLLGGAVALLPAYAHDVLHADSTGLGLLRAAPGIGASLTSLVLAARPPKRHVGLWMFGGVAVFGLATVWLGQTRSLVFAMAALFLTGAGDMVSVYVRHILVQLETPDSIRGRVSAVNAVFIGASNELGEFESGLVAAWLGLLPAIVAGGLATLAVTLIWAWRFPSLSKMDRFPELATEAEAAASPT
ncbi:MAG TPA: MFS transporter [Polyangiaceae bacterium]|nr:MFS transporter [Polyangiaceae bacterium]